MRYGINQVVSGLLSACVCIGMATSSPVIAGASSGTFVDENFNNGSTKLVYRKNTLSGTVTDSTGAIESGVLKLTKSSNDGITAAYASFPLQGEGIVTVKADISSNLNGAALFKLSQDILGGEISLTVRDNRLVLVCGEKEADAGAFTPDEWKSYRMEIDYTKNCVTLFCNESRAAAITDAQLKEIGNLSFSLTKSGSYMNIDNVSVFNNYTKEEIFWDIQNSDAKDDILSLVEKGIMQGMGDGSFSPDTNLTRAQMAQIITNALNLTYSGEALNYSDVSSSAWYNYAVGAVTSAGIMNGMGDGTFQPDKLLTFEEVSKILTESAGYAGISGGKYNFGESFDKIYINSEISDSEAVKFDSEKLDIGSLVVFDDIDLPLTGEYGSEISWSSSSDCITSDGKITRPYENAESAVLTATIAKGGQTATKQFQMSVMPSNTSWTVTDASTPYSELLVEQTGDIVSFDFDIIPGNHPLNTVLGFGTRDSTLSSFTEMPVIVRFNPDGAVDAYNGNTYMADRKVVYQKGEKLTIRVEVNLAQKHYSVWVKSSGSMEAKIASEYSYRSSAVAPASIGKMYIKRGSTTVDGSVEVTRMSIAAPEEIVNAESYLFDRNYAAPRDASDVLADLRTGSKILPGTQLPVKNSGGKEIIWISSDERMIDADGKITDGVDENASFTLTAVINDGSPNAYYLLSQKDKISNWAFSYVTSAMNMGIVQSILSDDNFDPKMPISREYAAVLVNRLMNTV